MVTGHKDTNSHQSLAPDGGIRLPKFSRIPQLSGLFLS